jgi:hypothetical protein
MQYLGLPLWGEYLLEGILIFIGIASAAVVLTRMGRHPFFALLLLVPYMPVIAIWYLAFCDWPQPLKKAD